MNIYSYYGLKDFVICTGYKNGLINQYFDRTVSTKIEEQ